MHRNRVKLCQLALTDTELKQESYAYKYIEQIYNVLQAGIEQNQLQFQSLLVQGQMSKDTARVFRILQQNHNCFLQSAVNQLKLAAKISTMNVSQTETNNNNHRGRSRESFNGRSGVSFSGNLIGQIWLFRIYTYVCLNDKYERCGYHQGKHIVWLMAPTRSQEIII